MTMRHLEEVTGRIAMLGRVTTTVVYSSPLAGRDLQPSVLHNRSTPAAHRQSTAN